MSWPTARAALKTLLDATPFDAGSDYETEVLVAYEFPPNSGQVDMFPFAFIHPPREELDVTFPNVMHQWDIEARVEIVLGPSGNNFEALAMRREALVTALRIKATASSALNLSGTVGAVTRWTFSELRQSDWFQAEGGMWGFDAIVAMNGFED